MQEKQHDRFVATPGEHLRRCVQSRSGARFTQETHVLRLNYQSVRSRLLVHVRERKPPRETGQRLLDARQVIARIEVAYVIAFPCVDAAAPNLDGRPG